MGGIGSRVEWRGWWKSITRHIDLVVIKFKWLINFRPYWEVFENCHKGSDYISFSLKKNLKKYIQTLSFEHIHFHHVLFESDIYIHSNLLFGSIFFYSILWKIVFKVFHKKWVWINKKSSLNGFSLSCK